MTQDNTDASNDAVSTPEVAPEAQTGEATFTPRAESSEDGKKPFEKKPFDKKFGDKKFGDKKGPKKPALPAERIAKVLARAGLASRREVERLIGLGKIAVNGRILETPAVTVTAEDIITVEGKPIRKAEPTRVWRYHKPVGLMTTHQDPQGRPTVFSALPADLPRVISVGRLDLNSEGLLLLTNDGELARALELPATGWTRVYRVRALGRTTQAALDSLKDGTTVEGVHYGPIDAKLDKAQEKADGRANLWITVSLTEGKNREVRKVLDSLGLKVNRLIRMAYGPFQLGNLEAGEVEEVGPRVIRELLADKIDPRNLPSEGATQTQSGFKSRKPEGDSRSEGRRGGGDRFAQSDRTKSDRPSSGERSSFTPRPDRAERSFGDKPRFDKPKGDFKPRSDKPRGDFKPREDGFRRDAAEQRTFKERDFDQRPRFDSDGPARDRAPSSDRPARAYGDKPRFDKPKGDFKPRSDRPSGDRSFGDKPRGDFKPRADRPIGERSYGDKPRFDRPREDRPREGGEGYRGGRNTDRATSDRSSFTPRPDRAERSYGDKPRFDKPKYDKPAGDRPSGERSYSDKPRGDFKPRSDRPSGERSYSDKPRGDFKPRSDRPSGERSYGDKPRGDFKPRSDRPSGERSYGDKPRGDFKPRSDRPSGERSFGGKPGGKPGFGARPGGSRPGGSGGGRPSGGKPFGGANRSAPRKPRPE